MQAGGDLLQAAMFGRQHQQLLFDAMTEGVTAIPQQRRTRAVQAQGQQQAFGGLALQLRRCFFLHAGLQMPPGAQRIGRQRRRRDRRRR